LADLIFEIEDINPVEICGVNDQKLNFLGKFFPKLKLIARGNSIKIMGEEAESQVLFERLKALVTHFNRYGRLNESDIEAIVDRPMLGEDPSKPADQSDVLVFGNNGAVIKARTPNQALLVKKVEENDMVFAMGPAGTGKTYTAVALAVRALKNRNVKRIVLTRPAVEAGENLGFLPGDLKEKLDPYLQPLYDALRDMLPGDKLANHMESGVIQIAPLAFMRGRTLDHSFVILDEAQNATQSQMKMFLTRMGPSAKFVITGDPTQVDLPRNQPSGLIQAARLLKNIKGIGFVHLDATDVIRHRLVKEIIHAYYEIDPNNPTAANQNQKDKE
jgi:phosphate starvation-inducible protein PhoH and related proteins